MAHGIDAVNGSSHHSTSAQCKVDCIVASICSIKSCPVFWESSDLDMVINKGTQIYSQLLQQNEIPNEQEVPNNITLDNEKYQINTWIAITDELHDNNLYNAITSFIIHDEWNHLLIKTSCKVRNIAKYYLIMSNKQTNIYFFNPYSSNSVGYPVGHGTCTLLYYKAVEDCAAYIHMTARYYCLTEFEITPLIIKHVNDCENA